MMLSEEARPSKRIAILLPDLRGGGVERVRIVLAREFLARCHAVDFVLMRAEGELIGLVPEGARVVDLGALRFRDLLGPLVRYLRRERPDAVLAAMWPLTSMAVLARGLARWQGRLVVSDHGVLSISHAHFGSRVRTMLRWSMALTYPHADARIAVSDGVARDLSQLSGLPVESFKVIYNPITVPSESDDVDVDRAWGVPSGKRILNVGSLKDQKNQALLLRAFSRLGDLEHARLMILGEGALRGSLEDLTRSEGLSGRVLMPGFVEDPTPYFRSADIFVLSSDYEAFGNVIVEALACGLPVVATDCPYGPREILDGGRYGDLVSLRDDVALSRAMRSALSAPVDRERLMKRAEEFSVEKAFSAYESLIIGEKRI